MYDKRVRIEPLIFSSRVKAPLFLLSTSPPNPISQVKFWEVPLTRPLTRGFLLYIWDYLPYLFVIWLVPGRSMNESRSDFFFFFFKIVLIVFKQSRKVLHIHVYDLLERLNGHPLFHRVFSLHSCQTWIYLLIFKFHFSVLWNGALIWMQNRALSPSYLASSPSEFWFQIPCLKHRFDKVKYCL